MNIQDKISYLRYYKKLRAIKLLVADVDGVLTDGSIITDDNAIESRVFNAQDGLAMYIALSFGLRVAVITGSTAPCILHRFEKYSRLRGLMNDDVIIGQDKKMPVLLQLCEKYRFRREQVAYIGDDLIDLSCMNYVGLSFAPSDAVDDVRSVADVVVSKCGGRGAFRMAVDMILKARGVYKDVIKTYYNKV